MSAQRWCLVIMFIHPVLDADGGAGRASQAQASTLFPIQSALNLLKTEATSHAPFGHGRMRYWLLNRMKQ